MTTTIQVADDTIQILKRMRESISASSYNEVIQHLARKEQSRRSFWGAGKRKMKMKSILEGLRDEGHRM